MATYAFECRGCGEQFEVNRPMSEHGHLRQEPPELPEVRQERYAATGHHVQQQTGEHVLTHDERR